MYLQSGLKEFGYLKHLMIVNPSEMSKGELNAYITSRDINGREEWLFDSFLLVHTASSGNFLGADINIGATMSGEGDFYAVPASNPGNKKDAVEAIDKYIEGCRCLSSGIKRMSAVIGQPEHLRNIVVSVPYPVINQCSYGRIDGRNLNFSVLGQNLTKATADRYTACRWFMDEFLAKWENANIDNLNFIGFYWPFETVYRGWEVDDHWLLKELHKYVLSRGKKMFWIPFWASYNVHLLDDYQSYYFDAAFMQPNYLFYKKIKGLKEAAEAARERNAGFEMEYYMTLNEPTRVGSERHKRFREYLNGGVELGYMNGACAWFVGGGFHKMLDDPDEMEFYYDIVDFVKGRYKVKPL